jgi:hypothetical protein
VLYYPAAYTIRDTGRSLNYPDAYIIRVTGRSLTICIYLVYFLTKRVVYYLSLFDLSKLDQKIYLDPFQHH